MGVTLLECQHCATFLGSVDGLSSHCLVKVYLMSVKLRTVNASKLYLAAYGNTAGTTHASTIHHDGIQADNGRDLKLLGKEANKLHHDHGADGNANVIFLSLSHKVLDGLGNHSASAVRTVIRGNVQVSCNGFHLLFKDQKALRLTSHDHVCTEIDADEEEVIVMAEFSAFGPIQKYLEDNGFDIKEFKFERIPNDMKKLTPEQQEEVEKLLEKIEEDEDVTNVFHNMVME